MKPTYTFTFRVHKIYEQDILDMKGITWIEPEIIHQTDKHTTFAITATNEEAQMFNEITALSTRIEIEYTSTSPIK